MIQSANPYSNNPIANIETQEPSRHPFVKRRNVAPEPRSLARFNAGRDR
jgi:hypothetical protein